MGWGVQSLLCMCCNTPDIWGSHHDSGWGGRTKCRSCMWTVYCAEVHGKGVTREIPDRWAKPRMLHYELKHKGPFVTSRKCQPAPDFPWQKCIIILRRKVPGQIVTSCGEGPNCHWTLSIAWLKLRAVWIANGVGSCALINLYLAQQVVGSFCLQTTGTALFQPLHLVSLLLELKCSIIYNSA